MENCSTSDFLQMRGCLVSAIRRYRDRALSLCRVKPGALFSSFLGYLELRPVLWRKRRGAPDIIHRLPIYPSDSHNDRDGSTWTGEVTATLPAYLCNSYPFYWSRQSMAHTVTTVLHIPQTCSLLKSLCKYCLLSKWNQNPILWPNPPRYPLCIFPLKKCH